MKPRNCVYCGFRLEGTRIIPATLIMAAPSQWLPLFSQQDSFYCRLGFDPFNSLFDFIPW